MERRHGAPVDEARPGRECRERERDGMRQGAHPRFLERDADRPIDLHGAEQPDVHTT
jgi:hypothetical protein